MSVTNEEVEPYNPAEIEDKWKKIKDESSISFNKYWEEIVGKYTVSNGMYFDYGRDCILLYVMFMIPSEPDLRFGDDQADSVYHFLMRVWRLGNHLSKFFEDKELNPNFDKTINDDLFYLYQKLLKAKEEKKYHNIVSLFMSGIRKLEKDAGFTDHKGCHALSLEKENADDKRELKLKKLLELFSVYLYLLAEFAPFICQELWGRLFGNKSIFSFKMPEIALENNVTMTKYILQVNGKTRCSIFCDISLSKEEIISKAYDSLKGREHMNNPLDKFRIIFVSGELINFVLKEDK
ncbi:class I tRNA ligase family protein [Butyrivibrio sp. NC3005]|uniref:class I tRNA ligase family protein n=1 Tax=Butyrivibrio sp. NC3005 TaxID=1280685 RepID=UPI00040A6A5E|nr:class I tRNA ligase family protein [Butyrivibrio sp. NC3005]